MWNIVANKNRAYGVKAFVCDEDADMEDLPISGCKQGSTVFVISSSKTYMLNGDKEWVTVTLPASGASGGTSSGTDTSSNYTIVDGGTASE